MSHGTIDKDTKIPEIACGTPVVIACHQRGEIQSGAQCAVSRMVITSMADLARARAIRTGYRESLAYRIWLAATSCFTLPTSSHWKQPRYHKPLETMPPWKRLQDRR